MMVWFNLIFVSLRYFDGKLLQQKEKMILFLKINFFSLKYVLS